LVGPYGGNFSDEHDHDLVQAIREALRPPDKAAVDLRHDDELAAFEAAEARAGDLIGGHVRAGRPMIVEELRVEHPRHGRGEYRGKLH
jgi:hypothetical protein